MLVRQVKPAHPTINDQHWSEHCSIRLQANFKSLPSLPSLPSHLHSERQVSFEASSSRYRLNRQDNLNEALWWAAAFVFAASQRAAQQTRQEREAASKSETNVSIASCSKSWLSLIAAQRRGFFFISFGRSLQEKAKQIGEASWPIWLKNLSFKFIVC